MLSATWRGRSSITPTPNNITCVRCSSTRAIRTCAKITRNFFMKSAASQLQQLLPWALGEPGVDQAKVCAAIADTPENDASYFLTARQDVDGYNAGIESRGAILEAYYFANLYSSKPHGHAMLRDPRVKALLVRYGFPAYWREKGWPVGCRPLGEADFECGTDAAPVH